MKVINLTLVVIALFIQCSLFAQKDELPVIKANSIMADIKDDNVLKKNYWRIIPEYKLDVYTTTGKVVTFYTDLDSITFIINPEVSKEYDFIILLNEKDSARTQIKYQKQSRDVKELITNSFDVYTIISTNKPDNFNPRAINQGIRHSMSFKVPFGKSDFSMSIGAGIGFQNYYIDALPNDILPASMRSDDFYFVKINSFSDPKISYKKNKMVLTYIDIPLELRYVSKKGLKISAGTKIDFLANSFFKFIGTDFLYGTDDDLKIRKYNLKNLSKYQFGPIIRIGNEKLSLYATYSFTPVYNKNGGEKLNPICVGLSFTPLN